jgi:hypothetical protein
MSRVEDTTPRPETAAPASGNVLPTQGGISKSDAAPDRMSRSLVKSGPVKVNPAIPLPKTR